MPQGCYAKANSYCVLSMYKQPPDPSIVPGACQNLRFGQQRATSPSIMDEHGDAGSEMRAAQ